ncbi:Alpha/Beta hydrolase protein [Rhexocercosporidium sp. MPI-PUGE-AT-0058]|nr:Alpha/Beta hydrolase protein [Rhexocercosporidium sp. MPI-PUGE-AT-0058]
MASSEVIDKSALRPEIHKPGVFPDPIILPPQMEHRQSIIILHGRGSFAAKFAPPLLATKATGRGETLQEAFPNAKIIFPTASRNRATIYKRSYTHQWFNNWYLEKHTERQDLIPKELRRSVLYIHGLLKTEIEAVGAENAVLWGLSQGCATTLAALLTWDGEPFAAAVGMCGWLPFANVMTDLVQIHGSNGVSSPEFDDDDYFALSREEDDDPFTLGIPSLEKDLNSDSAIQAVTLLREELDMNDKNGTVFRHIPIFLGHGTDDQRVNINLGRESQKCMELLGAGVRMVEYEGLEHWYSKDMLRDIFEFLKEKLALQMEEK